MSEGDEKSEERTSAADRWWVESATNKGEKGAAAPAAPKAAAGMRFFRAAAGFEQEAARARLTDLNMKLLVEANPPEGGWGYVRLAETAFPERERERIKEAVRLPSYARGVVVDCGRSVRLLITGTPIGQRILDLALGESPSFDCWINGDWVREAVFPDRRRAIGGLRRFIQEFLSPEGIAAWEAMLAQA
jgi:hypothetical protein